MNSDLENSRWREIYFDLHVLAVQHGCNYLTELGSVKEHVLLSEQVAR